MSSIAEAALERRKQARRSAPDLFTGSSSSSSAPSFLPCEKSAVNSTPGCASQQFSKVVSPSVTLENHAVQESKSLDTKYANDPRKKRRTPKSSNSVIETEVAQIVESMGLELVKPNTISVEESDSKRQKRNSIQERETKLTAREEKMLEAIENRRHREEAVKAAEQLLQSGPSEGERTALARSLPFESTFKSGTAAEILYREPRAEDVSPVVHIVIPKLREETIGLRYERYDSKAGTTEFKKEDFMTDFAKLLFFYYEEIWGKSLAESVFKHCVTGMSFGFSAVITLYRCLSQHKLP